MCPSALYQQESSKPKKWAGPRLVLRMRKAASRAHVKIPATEEKKDRSAWAAWTGKKRRSSQKRLPCSKSAEMKRHPATPRSSLVPRWTSPAQAVRLRTDCELSKRNNLEDTNNTANQMNATL
ncbi:hypothetical protein HispidOSU_028475 [Sigmodon hispidus]